MVRETVCVVRRTSVRRLWWSVGLGTPKESETALLIEWCDESPFSFPLLEVDEPTPAAEPPKVNDYKCCLGISYPSLAEEQRLCNVELVERKLGFQGSEWVLRRDCCDDWDWGGKIKSLVVLVLLGIDWEEDGPVLCCLEPRWRRIALLRQLVAVWCRRRRWGLIVRD